jgi:hypothetical protein
MNQYPKTNNNMAVKMDKIRNDFWARLKDPNLKG